MIVYVQREAGAIVGVFSRVQPGRAEEALADSDPEVAAFRSAPATRRLVAKSTVVARLIAAGRIGAAKAALEADPAAWARWTAADRPAVYADDPDAIALLQAIGADPAVILA